MKDVKKESKPVQKKEPKLEKISFDPKQLGVSDDEPCVYGINVLPKDGLLVGECDPIVAKALKDAKKAL